MHEANRASLRKIFRHDGVLKVYKAGGFDAASWFYFILHFITQQPVHQSFATGLINRAL